MDICGVVTLEVKLRGIKTVNQEFKVLNSKSYSNILLGRDFMKRFGSIKLDFVKNRVKLGKKWVHGVDFRNARENVRLAEESVIPARSEQVVTVRCKNDKSLCESDFVPKLRGVRGVFVSKARVSPNLNGCFQVTVMNVTESDVKLHNRLVIGSIHKADCVISSIDRESAHQEVFQHLEGVSINR